MKSEYLHIIYLIFLQISTVIGQEFAPIGAKWYYNSMAEGLAPPYSEYYLYESMKDTFINEQSVKKITRTYYRYRGDSVILTPYFISQIEDTIFLYNPLDNVFDRLYIFNAIKGDTLTFDMPFEYELYWEQDTFRVIVDTVYLETYDGIQLKKYVLIPIDGFYWFYGFYLDKAGGYDWFLPRPEDLIPEFDGPLRCYIDKEVNINFVGYDCDYRIVNSVNNHYENEFKIYPNPCNGLIYIESDFKIDRITLTNTDGKILSEYTKTIIDINDLDRGIYFINVYLNDNLIIKKIIKN